MENFNGQRKNLTTFIFIFEFIEIFIILGALEGWERVRVEFETHFFRFKKVKINWG